MKTKLVLTLSIMLGSIIAQAEMNYSYEMKYGKGKEVRGQASSNPYTTDYSYFENLLDINTYFGDKIYTFTQLEYSNPPIYGYDRDGLDSMLSTFYIEYSHDRYNLKLGDLYELYGRGLSFYTFQNQNIDYDNSIKGLTANYFLKENLKVSTLLGTGGYSFRSNPANRKTNPEYQFDANTILGSINYDNDLLGYFQAIYLTHTSFLPSDLIRKIYIEQYNEIGEELNLRCASEVCLNTDISDTIYTKNYNLNWNIIRGSFDIYIDNSWIYYNKIYGNKVFGSRFYTSIYTELLGIGITYEYKNYNTPYLLKSISNPPIVYREGNSILASRNSHSINFGNEIGHQFDFNKNINGNLNILGNLSISHRHQKNNMLNIEIADYLFMKDKDAVYDYYPFRQAYLEMNGWALSERLYYKVGLDRFIEFVILIGNDSKHTYATTIPTQWMWKLTNGSSLTLYMETQRKIVKQLSPQLNSDDYMLSNETQYTNNYLSLSYSHMGKWIATGFYDQEIKDSKTNQWIGADLSYKLNTKTQISFFYGSQKGGLVCANGICAEQPGFEDGYKITFRSLF